MEMEDYSFRSTTFDYVPSYYYNSSYDNSTIRNDLNTASNDSNVEYASDLYDVPAGLIALLSFFYGSISVLAVVGNSLVMWIVATSRRMQNVTNCFIANLALADIVIGLFAIPFQFQAALLQKWNLPYFMCPFCPFVQVLSVNVSVFTLTAIAVDRHRAILNPLSARPSKKIAKIIIGGIWLLGLIIATPMVIALRVKEVDHEDKFTKQTYKKPFCDLYLSERNMVIYRTILLFLQYLTPLCVISFVYTRMALRLWGSRAPGNAQDSRDANLMKNKKKVIKMLVIVVALFALCWLPLQTYQVLQTCFPQINEYRYINIIFFCCDWLAMSNSCYNPFIYGIYNEKFKREFKQRFPCGRSTWNHTPPTDSYDMDKSHSIVHTRHSSLRSNYDWRRSTRQQQTISNQFGQNRTSWNHQSLHNRKLCNVSNNYIDDMEPKKPRNPNKNSINFCLGNDVRQPNNPNELNKNLLKSPNGTLTLRDEGNGLFGDENCDRFVTELYVFSPGNHEERNGFGKIEEISEFNA